MRKVNVKLLGFEGWPRSYFVDFIKTNPDFEAVQDNQDNQDIVIVNINTYSEFGNTIGKKNQKVLVFSGENIFPRCGDKIRRVLDILKKIKLHILAERFVLKFLKGINKPNHFFILTNALKKSNILNLPYFFDTHLPKVQEFIDIKKQNLYTDKKKFCAFLVTNPDATDRIDLFKKLSNYKKVDSFGPVLNNAAIPEPLLKKYKLKGVDEIKDKTQYDFFSVNEELFREYKFVICYENTYDNDYITEKLPCVMMGNAIGIYQGAPNISEFFNTKSFINYDDYKTDEAVIEKIIALDNDPVQYQQMLCEPFFKDNKIPPRLATAKDDLKNFIHKIMADS